MTPSKASKILKRTAMGSALVLSLIGLLWWTSQTSDGKPILIATALILFAALFEVSRMGALASRDLRPALFIAATGVLVLAVEAGSAEGLRDGYRGIPIDLSQTYRARLWLEYGFAALIGAALFAWSAFGLSRIAAYAIAAVACGFMIDESLEVVWRLEVVAAALALWSICTLPVLVWRHERGRDLAIVVGLALWIVPPLPALWSFWRDWGMKSLIALLVLSKIGDTFGYYVGSAIGKRHPFPTISPGKTVAGCVGSFIGATATGGALAASGLMSEEHFRQPLQGMIAGALINVAAQSGDLLESWVKRRAAVKDSSSVFGPSGGVLDQVDSLLLTIPVATAIWPYIGGAG